MRKQRVRSWPMMEDRLANGGCEQSMILYRQKKKKKRGKSHAEIAMSFGYIKF